MSCLACMTQRSMRSLQEPRSPPLTWETPVVSSPTTHLLIQWSLSSSCWLHFGVRSCMLLRSSQSPQQRQVELWTGVWDSFPGFRELGGQRLEQYAPGTGSFPWEDGKRWLCRAWNQAFWNLGAFSRKVARRAGCPEAETAHSQHPRARLSPGKHRGWHFGAYSIACLLLALQSAQSRHSETMHIPFCHLRTTWLITLKK